MFLRVTPNIPRSERHPQRAHNRPFVTATTGTGTGSRMLGHAGTKSSDVGIIQRPSGYNNRTRPDHEAQRSSLSWLVCYNCYEVGHITRKCLDGTLNLAGNTCRSPQHNKMTIWDNPVTITGHYIKTTNAETPPKQHS